MAQWLERLTLVRWNVSSKPGWNATFFFFYFFSPELLFKFIRNTSFLWKKNQKVSFLCIYFEKQKKNFLLRGGFELLDLSIRRRRSIVSAMGRLIYSMGYNTI